MARTALCPESGVPVKNDTMHPAELRMVRHLLGVVRHRQEAREGAPRALPQEEFGKLLRPPVNARTIYNWEHAVTPVPTLRIPTIRKLKRKAMEQMRSAERVKRPAERASGVLATAEA